MMRDGGDSSSAAIDLFARMRDDGNVGSVKSFSRAVGEYAPEMRKLGLDVLAVGADERRGVDDGVVDADLVALAEQRFRQVDIRTLTQVVAVGLEAQSEQGDPMTLAGEDSVDGILDRQPIARQGARQQRDVDAFRAGQIEEGSKILRQARSTEGEARPQVLGRNVEGSVLTEEAHDLPAVDSQTTEDSSEFVGERDLRGVEGVARVLEGLSGARVDDSKRRIKEREEA